METQVCQILNCSQIMKLLSKHHYDIYLYKLKEKEDRLLNILLSRFKIDVSMSISIKK